MAEDTCYICSQPPRAMVTPTMGGTMWAVPLCTDHLGPGTALLMRMFGDDPELETDCAVVPMHALDLHTLDEDPGRG